MSWFPVRRTGIQTLLLAAFLSVPAFSARIILSVVAQDPQTFIEQTTNPLTTVTFTVTNNDPNNAYILDFALEYIHWPGEQDDQVWNTGAVSAATFIPAATPANILANANVGLYTYTVFNKFGDPTDCCDPGVNPIDFFIEMSPMATQPSVANIVTGPGYGITLFPVGGSSTGTENATQFAALFNCFNNVPDTCEATAQNGTPLFSNGVDGLPYPATTSVTVNDTPEPSAWILCLTGALFLLIRTRRSLVK
jgi:hypothetical protein